MSNIKRYDIKSVIELSDKISGDYVLFSDHEQRVKELEAENKELKDSWQREREDAAIYQVVDDLQAKLDRARKALVRLQVRIVESREPSKEDIEASRIIINETLAELKGEK